MVSLAACVAGCVLCGSQSAVAEQAGAPAWLPVYGKNGQLQYLGFAQAENTYPVRFIEYLSRLLLNYDEASRGVFKSNVEPMEVLPKAQRQKAMFDEFVRFSTSGTTYPPSISRCTCSRTVFGCRPVISHRSLMVRWGLSCSRCRMRTREKLEIAEYPGRGMARIIRLPSVI